MTEQLFASATITASVSGRGPRLVLLHSLLADRGSFDRVTDTLATHFTVMLPALPGFTGSAAVDGDLATVADRMAEAITEFSDHDDVMLLGNGYGGFVALQIALRHPTLAKRLVLADAGAAFSEAGRETFRGMARGAASKGLEGVADIAMRRLFAPDFHAANPELVAIRRASFLQSDLAVFIGACEALAALDLRPALPSLRLPVLAVVGAQDEATPAPMSRELVSLVAGATLVVLEGCAHVPQLQAPEKFLAAVLPFLTTREKTS